MTNRNLFVSPIEAEESCITQAFDVIIIGSGPAGLQAGIYGASEGLKTAIVESNRIGGQIGQTTLLENVLGHPDGITGEQIRRGAKHQYMKWNDDLQSELGYQVSTFIAGEAVHILDHGDYKSVVVRDMQTGLECPVKTRTVIIATGMRWDSASFNYQDIDKNHFHYGPERIKTHAFYGKKFMIIGGGNSACQAAVSGAEESHVTMVVRSDLNISEYLRPRIMQSNSIDVFSPYMVEEIESLPPSDKACHYRATLRNGKTQQVVHSDFHEMFYVANSIPNTEFLKETSVDLSSNGQIITRHDQITTNVDGIFAIGDVVYGATRRVATAIGAGSSVIPMIHKFVNEHHTCSLEVCA